MPITPFHGGIGLLLACLAGPMIVRAEGLDERQAATRRAYHEAYRRECERTDAREASAAISFAPEEAMTSLEGDVPSDEARAVDKVLVPHGKQLAACHPRISPHSGSVAVVYDFAASAWSTSAHHRALQQCVSEIVGRTVAKLVLRRTARLYITYAANRKPTAAESAALAAEKRAIQSFVREHIGDVRKCYAAVLAGWPTLSGRVDVRMTIEPDGRVSSARSSSSTTGLAELDCCVANAVRAWTLPPADGGMRMLTYPFVLTPD